MKRVASTHATPLAHGTLVHGLARCQAQRLISRRH
jgi:hypothetical protein